MSYILDALRKAEAERRMGAAPDMGAAPIFHATPPDQRSGRRGSRWLWVMLAAATGALATVAWLEWGTTAPPPRHATPAVSTLPATPPASAPAQAVPASTATVALHRPPPAIEPPAETAQNAPPASAARDTAVKAIAKPAAPENSLSRQPPSAAAIATLHELPPEIQRQIPSLAISGYIYAPDPADRSVLINQKLLHEGDEVAAGLTLEKLMPKGMVLNYKGYRYRSGY